MRVAAFGVLMVSALAATSSVSAQTVIVRVTAAESGSPLPRAFVSLLDEISFSEESHRSVDLEIDLVREAIQLAPVVVTAERKKAYLETEGFYRRRQEGAGTFVTPGPSKKDGRACFPTCCSDCRAFGYRSRRPEAEVGQ